MAFNTEPDSTSASSSKHRSSSRRDDDRDSKRHRSSRDDDGHRDKDKREHRDRDTHRDRDDDRRKSSSSSSHRHRSDKHSHSSHSHSHSHSSSSRKDKHSSSPSRSKQASVDDDDDNWVEKDAPTSLPSAVAPSRPVDTVGTFSISSVPTSSAQLPRLAPEDLTEGYGSGDVGGSNDRGGGAFGAIPGGEGGEAEYFGGMGIEKKRRERKEKVDPTDTMGQSSRELNKSYWQGVPNPSSSSSNNPSTPSAPSSSSAAIVPGSSGSAWRMTKLRRTYEAAEEEGKPIEEVAVDRYGSLEAFEEAREERRVLDQRGGGGGGGRRGGYGGHRGGGRGGYEGGGGGRPQTPSAMGADGGGRKFVFTEQSQDGGDPSRPSSRQEFRRPGEASTPQQQPHPSSSLARSASSASVSAANSRPATPIPSVFAPTPPASRTPIPRIPSQLGQQSVVLNPDPTSTSAAGENENKPVLSQSELNKLQARVLKAKLLSLPTASSLESEYNIELLRSQTAPALPSDGMASTLGGRPEAVEVLPTLDGRGRMYDTGVGTGVADEMERENRERVERGQRKKAKDQPFASHDPKTGEVIRLAADDSSLTLQDLVQQERFSGGGGGSNQREADAEYAQRIAGDARFKADLDYADENAEMLARKRMKSETMKRQFAIQDYARTKKALDSCTLCHTDSGAPPLTPVVALGTRVYLALMETEELVPGHCRIVPVQHHLSCLEVEEEEGWEEIKNFMKTLMQMFAEQDKGVVFFETITSHNYQTHSYIECIPVPFDLFDQLPIYFREAISTSESEWSQHQKLLTFTPSRPFRRALVPNLPYFAVQFDYKGEKGYGHVIEGVDDAPDRDNDGEEQAGMVGEKGGGEFPKFFAQEILGNLLSLPSPRLWRKPKRLDRRDGKRRVEKFREGYAKWDWTVRLAG